MEYKTRWGHVDKRSSDPLQAYPEVKLQGRELVRVVGIVAPFIPLGDGTQGKFVLSSPRGEIGPGDVCRVPLAAIRHGRAEQTSESGLCGDCRRGLWVPDPWCQYSGKIRFIEKHGVQEEGVAKNSSDPRQAYPEVKLQGWDLMRAVDIVGAGTKHWDLSYPLSVQRSLWSVRADAQADLKLRWAHMSFCWFCRAAAQIVYCKYLVRIWSCTFWIISIFLDIDLFFFYLWTDFFITFAARFNSILIKLTDSRSVVLKC